MLQVLFTLRAESREILSYVDYQVDNMHPILTGTAQCKAIEPHVRLRVQRKRGTVRNSQPRRCQLGGISLILHAEAEPANIWERESTNADELAIRYKHGSFNAQREVAALCQVVFVFKEKIRSKLSVLTFFAPAGLIALLPYIIHPVLSFMVAIEQWYHMGPAWGAACASFILFALPVASLIV
jgi:hypothetical protein